MILRGAAVLVSVVHPPHGGQHFLGAHLVLDCSGEPEGGQGVAEARSAGKPQDDFDLAALDALRIGCYRNWPPLHMRRGEDT